MTHKDKYRVPILTRSKVYWAIIAAFLAVIVVWAVALGEWTHESSLNPWGFWSWKELQTDCGGDTAYCYSVRQNPDAGAEISHAIFLTDSLIPRIIRYAYYEGGGLKAYQREGVSTHYAEVELDENERGFVERVLGPWLRKT